jgi:hypothetical protein
LSRFAGVFVKGHEPDRHQPADTEVSVHLGVEQHRLYAVTFKKHASEIGVDASVETSDLDQAQAVPPTVRPSISRVG